MTQEHQKSVRAYEQQIRKLKRELERAHREIIAVRNMWFEVFEDLEAEWKRERNRLEHQLKKMEERAVRAEAQRMPPGRKSRNSVSGSTNLKQSLKKKKEKPKTDSAAEL